MKTKKIKTKCCMCKKNIVLHGGDATLYLSKRRNGKAYCSEECKKEYLFQIRSITMANTNRKYASARMKKNNPMKRPEILAKQKATMKRLGLKPKTQGGNGKPIPVPQMLLARLLKWKTEVAVKTKMKKDSGYPTCYKIDIANETLKIGVEVDGGSHNLLTRKAQDTKKETFLIGLGWRILRFKNKEVMQDPRECIKKIMSLI